MRASVFYHNPKRERGRMTDDVATVVVTTERGDHLRVGIRSRCPLGQDWVVWLASQFAAEELEGW